MEPQPDTEASQVPCISCRLRRKKCDKQRPRCSRCERAGLGQEWCIYKEGTTISDKSSKGTLATVQIQNRELKRQFKHWKELSSALGTEIGKSTGDNKKNTRSCNGSTTTNFFSGMRADHTQAMAKMLGIEGYLGSIALSSTIWVPTRNPSTTNLVFSMLAKERDRQDMKKKQLFLDDSVALHIFEEKCLASTVGISVSNGDQLIRDVLDEITARMYYKPYFDHYFEMFTQVNGTRHIFGFPAYPESLLHTCQTVIRFEDDYTARLNFDLETESEKLVILSLTLMILSVGQFIATRQRESSYQPRKINPSLFSRYTKALLQVNLMGDKIRYPDMDASVLLTLSQLQVRLYDQYTTDTIVLGTQRDPQENVFTTRELIARAKFQHLHEDLDKHYPQAPKDYHALYKDIWHTLVMLDILATLDLGYLSSVHVSDFADSGAVVGGTLQVMHNVMMGVCCLDGEVSARTLMEYSLAGVKKIKEGYIDLGNSGFGTREADLKFLQSLDDRSFAESDDVASQVRGVQEREFTRIIMVGIIQSLYCLCWRCSQAIDDLSETQLITQCFHILANKYAIAAVSALTRLQETAYIVGNKPKNQLAQAHMLYFMQLISALEGAASFRSVLWLGAICRDSYDLDAAELAEFMLYHTNDEEMEREMVKSIATREEFEKLPEWEQLIDFDIDGDNERLVEELGVLQNPNVTSFMITSMMFQAKNFSKATYIDLGFFHVSKTVIVASRYCSFGLRYQFPEEVLRYLEAKGTLSPQLRAATDQLKGKPHGEIFREIYKDLIRVSEDKEFKFSDFFGPAYSEVLKESWARE